MTILTQQFVFDALEQEKSGVEFPIDFDSVWQDLGFTRKDNAVRLLKNSGYEFSKDILFKEGINKNTGNKYYLSIECFKGICMMANTQQGREVRRYFIEVEKTYRQQLERQFTQGSQTETIETLRLEINVLKDEIENLNQKLKSFDMYVIPNENIVMYDVNCIMNILNLLPKSPYNRRKKYIVDMIKRNGVKDKDYFIKGNHILVNSYFLLLLVICCRSLKGVDVNSIPNSIMLDIKDLAKYMENKKNTLFLQE